MLQCQINLHSIYKLWMSVGYIFPKYPLAKSPARLREIEIRKPRFCGFLY